MVNNKVFFGTFHVTLYITVTNFSKLRAKGKIFLNRFGAWCGLGAGSVVSDRIHCPFNEAPIFPFLC